MVDSLLGRFFPGRDSVPSQEITVTTQSLTTRELSSLAVCFDSLLDYIVLPLALVSCGNKIVFCMSEVLNISFHLKPASPIRSGLSTGLEPVR